MTLEATFIIYSKAIYKIANNNVFINNYTVHLKKYQLRLEYLKART